MMVKSGIALLVAAGLAILGHAVAAETTPGPVAKVDGTEISAAEFEAALSRSVRRTFYHGKVEADKLAEVRGQVLEQLIVDALLKREAERRGIAPDTAEVERRLAEYDGRYQNSKEWQAARAEILPQLRESLTAGSRVEKLQDSLRAVADPTADQLGAFYRRRIDAFTEPSRDRVGVILLKVDPSSLSEVWAAARDEAARLRIRLERGDDFPELAKLHSGDESAAKGGDMGYLHRGMLADDAQQAVDKLKLGEVSLPVQLLQGVALFKLLDRSAAVVHPLDRVRERAVALYKRETGEARWKEMIRSLRAAATVDVFAAIVLPQPVKGQ